ncbi:MAG: nucleoside triphosphate pyrophosphohydrolase [candidate division WOR-3 bacterium]
MGLKNLSEFVEIIKILRRECPWDRQQTLFSLRYQALEEVYEYIEAVEDNNKDRIKEEIGDLLATVIMLLFIAEDEGIGKAEEIVENAKNKLVFKHPHIFGDKKGWGIKELLRNWEITKKDGMLSGIDFRRPALILAHRLGEKVARVGFDWKSDDEVLKKVEEEFSEFMSSKGEDRFKELGDLLFTLAQFARKAGYYAEDSLKFTNKKFIERFSLMEKLAKERGKNLSDLTLEEMDKLWEETKSII